MASHNLDWVSSAHMRFKDPDFIFTIEGELAMATGAVRPPHSAGLDTIAKVLEELQLHALEAHAPGNSQLLKFNYGRLERQLSVFLGP